MIWLRRVLVVPLIIVLIAALQIATIANFTAGTLLTPQFYLDRLSESNIYFFSLNDLPISALSEIKSRSNEGSINYTDVIQMSDAEIVRTLNIIIPPEWVKSSVESSGVAAGDYIRGTTEEFDIHIPLANRAAVASQQLKKIIESSNLHEFAMETQVKPAVISAASRNWPLGITVSEERLMKSVEEVASKKWVSEEITSALDEVIPYVVGEKDGFSINVRFDNRVEVASSELKQLLRESDYYNLLYDELMGPTIRSSIGELAVLPHQVQLTEEEIVAVLRKVAPPEWVEKQVENALDEAAEYLVGNEESLTLSIDISDNKEAAVDGLINLATKRLDEHLESLPNCSLNDVEQILASRSAELPFCYPSETGLKTRMKTIVDKYRKDVINSVRPRILESIPNSISFDESSLSDKPSRHSEYKIASGSISMSVSDTSAVSSTLHDLRELIIEGWQFTDNDLRSMITISGGEETWERFMHARELMSAGFKYSDSDLQDTLFKSGGQKSLDDLQTARNYLHMAGKYRFAAYAPAVLIAVFIGMLGGRAWISRLAWSAASTAIASLLIWAAWGPVFESLAMPTIESTIQTTMNQLITTPGSYPDTTALVVRKLTSIAESTVREVAGGIAGSGLNSFLFSIIFLVGAGIWRSWGFFFNLLPEKVTRGFSYSSPNR
ncbi:uncharacterized protein METZ01_LOCUS133046 [marine metagenome]|uniref:Uncharacterized protein n=1 Tax=marine metagenome TaxID=408172 RepID=A0A381YU92_9ZZZZ